MPLPSNELQVQRIQLPPPEKEPRCQGGQMLPLANNEEVGVQHQAAGHPQMFGREKKDTIVYWKYPLNTIL